MDNRTADNEFYKILSIISLIILVITIVIAILSNIFASYSAGSSDNYGDELQQKMHNRTKPSGNSNLESNPIIKQQIQIASATTKSLSGEEVYKNVCMSCHTSGAAGAPVIGNSAQWSDRIAEGKEHLYDQAINGVGIMPAKGGLSSLSDDEVKLAVDYIISKSN